ncbi:MAG: OsmC family protein [Verrucomicrobiota bacterium JB023]|nr:OsmC family protein [Verrucomicrobiota bacterium JB023]
MVEITIDYQGELHCEAQHGPSGSSLSTDAPVDNEGRGESFSPTDLLATSLGSCMATIMGIAARRKEVDLQGMTLSVSKEMSAEPPRRVVRLAVTINMPLPEDHPEAAMLQGAAMGCPVFRSIHPDIDVPVVWNWK